MAEEAKKNRLPFTKQLTVTAGGTLTGSGIDAGGGGIAALLPKEFKTGDALTIAAAGGPPAAQGTVRWCKAEGAAWKVGIQIRAEDWPAFAKFATFKTWAEEGPPKGTLYHYPNPHNHQILSVAAAPAPPRIAHQIYTQAIQTKMVVRMRQGEAIERTLAWAESEVEGFTRT